MKLSKFYTEMIWFDRLSCKCLHRFHIEYRNIRLPRSITHTPPLPSSVRRERQGYLRKSPSQNSFVILTHPLFPKTPIQIFRTGSQHPKIHKTPSLTKVAQSLFSSSVHLSFLRFRICLLLPHPTHKVFRPGLRSLDFRDEIRPPAAKIFLVFF